MISAKRAGKFDAGGASADDYKIQRLVRHAGSCLALREFKGQQDPAANFQRVFNGLEARSKGLPVVMAEVGVGGSGGHHQIIVGQLPVRGLDDAAFQIKILRLLPAG